AEHYDVPELAYFSSENFFEHIGTSHGIKLHFSYAHHAEGEPFNSQHILQAVIPKQPHGHELHLYRQDTDYFLMTVAIRYGAKVLQNMPVKSVEINDAGVTLHTCKGQQFEADYVVDAGGFRSLLAEQFGLRHHKLQTHSRAIFTHMVGVSCFHECTLPRESYQIPFQLSEGTLHHVFEGGWLWVIPFNNHAKSTNPLCSVGLMLDPRVHPANPDISAEEEFFQFIERFPMIASQFQQAKSVRNWTRTGRIQYGAKQAVGDRFCLLGQAAGFVDPLFSKGLYTALTCTSILADRLLAAKTTKDYSAVFFQPVERLTQAYIEANDRLVAYAYKSFSDYRLWSAFSVLWLAGAYLELVKLTSIRALSADRSAYYQQLQRLKLVGGSFAEFDQLAERVYEGLDRLNGPGAEVDIAQLAQQITQQLEQTAWMPHVFKAVLNGKNHLPRNKFHPRLFKPNQGFLGIGQYRDYFFENRSLAFFSSFYLRERTRYSQRLLRLKRNLRLWKREALHPAR
ncbi:MAG: tryptophan 7-halogenase, partial [Cyanobacteria bacterium P01_F01_bin.86]